MRNSGSHKRQKRRAAMTSAKYGGRPSMLHMLYVQSHGRCFYCGQRVAFEAATMDHLLPVTRGGPTVLFNLVLCCCPCNRQKGSRTLEEYRQAQGVTCFPGEQHFHMHPTA